MIVEGVGDCGKWRGTKLLWAIEPTGSRITLRHQGLNPDLECHRVCVAGWGHYFGDRLKNHLNGGAATPQTE